MSARRRKPKPAPDVTALYRADDPDGEAYDALAELMWPGFIEWACADPTVRADFTAETGIQLDQLDRPRTPIEVVVDQATGWRREMIARFVEWATVEIYGLEGAPKAVREAIAAGTFGKQLTEPANPTSRPAAAEPAVAKPPKERSSR